MNKRLCIGIQKLNPGWKNILNDLGLWFEEIRYGDELINKYSLLLLNEKPETDQLPFLKSYINEGGALLELKGIHNFNDRSKIHTSYKRTVCDASGTNQFQHIHFLDLFNKVELHRSSAIYDGLIHFDKIGKGIVSFFGADLLRLLQSIKYNRKRFYAGELPPPDEIVSSVSKHQLLEAFRATLAHLHYQQGLPFVQKWTSPEEKPVFCFRIDSDFGNRSSIQKLYHLLKKENIKATWFLHVEAHEQWLDEFQSFEEQEIALHGYSHGTSKSYQKTFDNILKGNDLLRSSELITNGYCAPYGIWNKALEKALSKLDFKYTSEFTYKYDGFPMSISTDQSRLQIPIHPICTGSLNRRNYSMEQMKNYFYQVIEWKSGRHEPIVFYHHPMQPGLKVLHYIFDRINAEGYHKLTFSEFTDYWQTRERSSFKAFFNGVELMIEQTTDCMLQASSSFDEFHLLKANSDTFDLNTMPKFEFNNRYLPSEQKVYEMRKTDLRLLKTSLLDWKNRIRL